MLQRHWSSAIGVLLVASLVGAGACDEGDDDSLRGGSGEGKPGEADGQPNPDDDKVVGATADGVTHIISDDWEVAPVKHGNNLKMINFAQMQSEVKRATGITWPDWETNRALFGAPDFAETFAEDRTPSPTKLITWRRMAFAVCAQMITRESTTPSLFSAIAPTAAISGSNAALDTQVTAVFKKFYLEPPTAAEVAASKKALLDIVGAGGTPANAWAGLCVAYLSSERFLTY